MAIETGTDSGEEYDVRTYEPGDRDGILSLLAREWGWRPDADWFDWKYVDDPYLEDVPITLAARDDEVVAVQGYVPCRLRWRDRTVSALKPVDAVVHPDHRRQGLYSRITECAIRYFREREPTLFFNYPNAASLGAQEKLGWSEVGIVPTYYRVQRPGALLPSDRRVPLAPIANAAATAGLSLHDRLSDPPGEFEIDRYRFRAGRPLEPRESPWELLESIYEHRVPGAVHVHREAAYYRWLLESPAADHVVYVARRAGRPVAAIVTRASGDGEVNVLDAVPMAANDAFPDLLAAVVADNDRADVISVAGETLPRDLLSKFGFVSYETPILSRFCAPTYMAVRPLGDESPFSKSLLADPDSWRLSFLEVKD